MNIKDYIYLDVETNSLQQYHKKYMNASVEKMHVDIGALQGSRVLCYHILVLTGSEVSAELLASKGVGTFNGEAGARPKLETKKLQLLHMAKKFS